MLATRKKQKSAAARLLGSRLSLAQPSRKFVTTAAASSNSTVASGYKRPSDILEKLALSPENPSLSLSANREWMLFGDEPPLPKVEILAKREEKLAGLRFDPVLKAPSRLDFAYKLTAQNVFTGERFPVDLPEYAEGIRYITFAPSSDQFCFVLKVKGEERLELWVCDLPVEGVRESVETRSLIVDREFNCISSSPYQYTPDGKQLLVKVTPTKSVGKEPVEPKVVGPSIQAVEAGSKAAPNRTYQDLLKNPFDEEKLEYFTTVEVLQLDVSTGKSELLPQAAGGRMIRGMEISPDGSYILAIMTAKPYSYSVPLGNFGKTVEIWSRSSDKIHVVADIPVNDDQPISFDACPKGPRGFTFHPCMDCELLFVEALDGGDPKNDPDSDGCRDGIFLASAKDDFALTSKTVLTKLELRYAGIDFTEDGIAWVSEFRWEDRKVRDWLMETGSSEKRLISERSFEDKYNDPGAPMKRRGKNYQPFIICNDREIWMSGSGASKHGTRPFVDKFNLDTFESTRKWRCPAGVKFEFDEEDAKLEVGGKVPAAEDRRDEFERVVCFVDDACTKVMISRQSKEEPVNYFLVNAERSEESEETRQVTFFEHPQPDLKGVQKELVRYKREDGVDLTARLYLPKDYKEGDKRPCLMWAYPREYKSAQAASQVTGSSFTFVNAYWASPLFWAAKGWIIMDDISLPIVGEGDAQPNDAFVEQLCKGAEAAVAFVTDERGLSERGRIAIGGHSYGAFMTAHLLSHTSLFNAGIARSGAYNRTLTPFSFQSEDRSMWEARDTYIEMSPLMHADKLAKTDSRMLLIHGQNDENAGTHCMQSERYFAALKGFGAECKLVTLPLERHSYLAEESVLHMLYEQEQWLDSV